MPLLFALAAVAAPIPIARQDAMERCAARVVALRHPGGMVDVSGINFEWLQASTAGAEWVIIGAIVEVEQGARVGRRFTCTTRGERKPRITFGKIVRM